MEATPVAKGTREHLDDTRTARLCAAMIAALKAHPEYSPDDKIFVLVDSEDDGNGQQLGYSDMELARELLAQIDTMCFDFWSSGLDRMAAP